MVDSKIKKATVSAAKKNITASGVRIENGVFVDDEGSIVERVAEKLPEGTTIFDIKISIEISDEESDSAEQKVGGHNNRLTQIRKRNRL